MRSNEKAYGVKNGSAKKRFFDLVLKSQGSKWIGARWLKMGGGVRSGDQVLAKVSRSGRA